MADQPLRLRTLSGQSVACSMWLLPDQTTVFVKLVQAHYEAWDKRGDAPGRPSPDAQYLVAMEGIQALQGGDGWPVAGDAWEQVLGGRRRLIVALSDQPGWGYVRHDVADPVGGTSRVTGFHVGTTNRRIVLDDYDLAALPTLDLAVSGARELTPTRLRIPRESITTEYTALDFHVPNHRSVSYGSSTSYYDNFTYPVGFSYAGPSISGSDTHLVVSFSANYASAPTAVTHNGSTCDQRVAQGAGGGVQLYMYDRNSPATSGTVAVTTPDTGGFVSTASYATGVDSASPRVDFDGANGTSTSPSVTSDSTTDGLAFTACGVGDSTTLTKDGSVTEILAIDNGNAAIGGGSGDVALFSGYETPASTTNTVTHTMGASVLWRIGQITLRAASGGGTLWAQSLL